MPEKRRFVQTVQKHKSCNPTFNETFLFQVPSSNLTQYELKMTVFDVDRCKKHNIIGHVCFPLRDLEDERVVEMWRDLERSESEVCEGGEVRVSLCYHEHLHTLTVVVFEGRWVTQEQGEGGRVAQLHLTLTNPQQKTLKTCKTCRLTLQHATSTACHEEEDEDSGTAVMMARFNESFQFKVPHGQVATVGVNIVANVARPGKKQGGEVGRCLLGGAMFCRGKELDHWNEMLSRDTESVVMWHRLTSYQGHVAKD